MSKHEDALTFEALPSDRYSVTSVITSSPYSLVAFAHDIDTEDVVLVKARTDIGTSKMRLKREADILDSLSHPQIPRLLAAELEGDVPYIVTEAKPGTRYVGKWLRKYPAIQLAAKLSLSALKPLGYVHEQGFLHRDIKTNNLALQFSGEAALLDFELGLHRNDRSPDVREAVDNPDNDDVRITQSGRVVGTADYISPERAHGLRGERETDIYSMGIVMHELLLGRLPFEGEGPTEVAHMHCFKEIDLSDTRGREIPQALLAIVERATQKEPRHRYASAGAMSEDIADYLDTARAL